MPILWLCLRSGGFFQNRKATCYLLCSLLLQQMSYFLVCLLPCFTERKVAMRSKSSRQETCQSFVLYWHICHIRTSTVLSTSPDSKAQSKRWKWKLSSYTVQPLLPAPGDALSLVALSRASQGHCTGHTVWRMCPQRWDQGHKSLLTSVPPYRCHSRHFSASSPNFLIEAPLQERCFIYTDSMYMAGSKDIRTERPGSLGYRKELGGRIVALYGSWKVRVWKLEDWGWLEAVTRCTCQERDLNYDEKEILKKD